MPVDRSEVEAAQGGQTLMSYQTLLGLLFDNRDTYFSEEELMEYVDRRQDILQIQLLIVRITGPTEEFPVEVSHVDGKPVYGLSTQRDRNPNANEIDGNALPDGLDFSKISDLLSERIEER